MMGTRCFVHLKQEKKSLCMKSGSHAQDSCHLGQIHVLYTSLMLLSPLYLVDASPMATLLGKSIILLSIFVVMFGAAFSFLPGVFIGILN